MDRLHLALTILSVVIIVAPIAATVYLYRSNVTGLVLPPELRQITSGNMQESSFKPPMPAGQPQYDAATGIATFSFNFTNPLENIISVDTISAEVVCKDHGVVLGNVSIGQPMTIAPGETVIINACGVWTETALDHFRAYHSGPWDDDINVGFKNLNVKMADVQIHLDELPDAGWVPLPPR